MMHGTTCKFCNQPITVEIDDGYAAMGDPFKLLKLAACNRCADLREEKRMLEAKFKRACSLLSAVPVGDPKRRETMRNVLEVLTKKYAEMIARWNGMDGSLWEEAILNTLMERPDRWASIIGKMWGAFREWKRQQELAV